MELSIFCSWGSIGVVAIFLGVVGCGSGEVGAEEQENESTVQAEEALCAGQLLNLHRYWNTTIGDHFYTTNWGELGGGKSGYVYEGVAAKVGNDETAACGTIPLYRYWNSTIGDHFYTTNWGELRGGNSGYIYEGVQGFCHPSPVTGTLPFYRYWNSGIGDHFYTTNWGELGSGASGWAFEGIQCYVYPA